MDLNWILLLAAIPVAATPILLAAIGELVCEKSGVLNLGVEGMMIAGAVLGFIAAVETDFNGKLRSKVNDVRISGFDDKALGSWRYVGSQSSF